MKKKEIVVIGVIFVLAVMAALGVKVLQNMGSSDKEVLVKQNGVIIKRIPLNAKTEETFTFKQGALYNKVVVENGEAHIESASCRDQICVHHPHVSKNGEVIVCLPNKLVVEIHSETEAVEIDSIVE